MQMHLTWLRDALLATPVIGGPSLSVSYIGTFLVFVYIWLPYMILPIEAALERVPKSFVEASADLGAHPRGSEEHTSELQSLMRISYAVFCLKKKNITITNTI